MPAPEKSTLYSPAKVETATLLRLPPIASFSTTVSSTFSDRVVVTASALDDVILHNVTSATRALVGISSDRVVVTASVDDDVSLHNATSATQPPDAEGGGRSCCCKILLRSMLASCSRPPAAANAGVLHLVQWSSPLIRWSLLSIHWSLLLI